MKVHQRGTDQTSRAKQKCSGLAGAYTILRNRVRYLKPLTSVPFPTFAFTAAVVMFVYHSLTCSASQQPHVVAVSTTSDTQVLPQSAIKILSK